MTLPIEYILNTHTFQYSNESGIQVFGIQMFTVLFLPNSPLLFFKNYILLKLFIGCDPSIPGRVHSQDAGLPEDGEHDLDLVQGPSGDDERRSADLTRGYRCSTYLHEGLVHGGGETN